MKNLIDLIRIWKLRREERKIGWVHDTELGMVRAKYPHDDIVIGHGKGKAFYFARGDHSLRALSVPTHYDCGSCKVVKGLAKVTPIADLGDLSKNPLVRYSCRICDETLFIDEYYGESVGELDLS